MPQLELEPIEQQAEELRGMSFLGHLEELRSRLIRSAIFVAAGFGLSWWQSDKIYGFMQRPILKALAHNGLGGTKLAYTSPTDVFNMYMKIGFYGGIALAAPFILWQIWGFISPGLYKHEKKYVVPFMVTSIGLFIAGGAFGYFVAFPAALDFLIGYSAGFNPVIGIEQYTDLFLVIIMGLGAIFELPILVFFLALLGMVSAGFMWKNLRYAILGIFVVAAILTPTTDIMNMCLFALPMVLLYIASIAIAWFVHPTQRRARAARHGNVI
jgi:sec-independent protein translocase protein TatC